MYTYSLAPGTSEPQVPETLGAVTPVSGKEYYQLNTLYTASGNNTTIYGGFYPIKFSEQATVSALSIRAFAPYGGASLSFRLGIYEDNNGFPGALLIDAGTLNWFNFATAGDKLITCSQVLDADTTYWVAVGCMLTGVSPNMLLTIGNINPFASLGLVGELGAAGYYFNHNGANALPSTAPTITAVASGFPRVAVRLAS